MKKLIALFAAAAALIFGANVAQAGCGVRVATVTVASPVVVGFPVFAVQNFAVQPVAFPACNVQAVQSFAAPVVQQFAVQQVAAAPVFASSPVVFAAHPVFASDVVVVRNNFGFGRSVVVANRSIVVANRNVVVAVNRFGARNVVAVRGARVVIKERVGFFGLRSRTTIIR